MALLEITKLRKSFVGPTGQRQMVIDVPSFQMEAGQQMALSGTSGSGKTTLLNLIAGILSPDSGSIRFLGTDICSLGEAKRDRLRADHLGYIFQTFNLLQGFTVLENVILGMAFGKNGPDRTRAVQLLEKMGLAERIHHFPRQLSTGQQQRVAVARALANQPKLVLADEPTGNLDATHARQALDLIRTSCQSENTALLLVSHDPSVLSSFPQHQSLADLNVASTAPGSGGTE